MKIKYILSAVIIPSIILFAAFKQGGNGKDNGGGKNKSEKNDDQGKGKHHSGDKDHNDRNEYENGKHKNQTYKQDRRDDNNNDRGEGYGKNSKHQKQMDKFHKKDKDKYYGNNGRGNNKEWKNDGKWVNDRWDDNVWDDNRFMARMQRLNTFNRNNWVNSRYYPGIVWFGANSSDYRNVKQPKDNKKVTMCHKPNRSEFPVLISVSENAVKAHLNHGDYLGECRDFDRSRYSDNYWDARKDYYNQYTNTTETLSFGEQLLALAVSKLTNARSQMVPLRSTLQQEELRRKEAALIKLQNDVYNLQNSLSNSNEQVGLQVNFTY